MGTINQRAPSRDSSSCRDITVPIWRFQQILPASLKLKPTVEKLIDNNVIEHADFEDPGSLGQPAGQPGISHRWVPDRRLCRMRPMRYAISSFMPHRGSSLLGEHLLGNGIKPLGNTR